MQKGASAMLILWAGTLVLFGFSLYAIGLQTNLFNFASENNVTLPCTKFSVTPLFGSVPLKVKIEIDREYIKKHKTVLYNYRFGDKDAEVKTIKKTVEHIYGDPGEYYIKVVSFDNKGNKSPTSKDCAQKIVAYQNSSLRLSWPPPGYPNYSGYVVYKVSNQSKNFVVDPNKNIDAIFKFVEPINSGLNIDGFRNVVIIGGEIIVEKNQGNALALRRITGTAHLEGLFIHGEKLVDGIGLSMGGGRIKNNFGGFDLVKGGDLQLENVRVEQNISDEKVHGDCLQLWSVPTDGSWGERFAGGVGRLKIDHFTGYTVMQCLLLINNDHTLGSANYTALEMADFRNINVGGKSDPQWVAINGQLLGKTSREDNFGRESELNIDNVWIYPTTSSIPIQSQVVPNQDGTTYGDKNIDKSRANILVEDQYITWPSSSDVTGKVMISKPTNGDFVPASSVGMNYVSPGYR